MDRRTEDPATGDRLRPAPGLLSEAPSSGPTLEDSLEAGAVLITCDYPQLSAPDELLYLPVRVGGWAYSLPGIESVVVLINDDVKVLARYGLSRPDVAAELSVSGAAGCGFTTLLDQTVCPPGTHRITVIATDRGGQSASVTGTIATALEEEELGPPTDLGPRGQPPTLRLDNGGERYVPELHRAGMIEAEHQARYAWAAQLAEDRVVLDAGCGVGWGTRRLAQAGARRAVGLDLDAPSIDSARERGGGEAEFVRGDLLKLPFDDASFDLVVCFEAIEHVERPEDVLDGLRRVLRPDGILVVSSPNRGVYPAGNPFHLRELSSGELETNLRSRFANVSMYRQQTHLGSMVSDDRDFAIDDPSVLLDAGLHKISAGEPGQELYTVALASDAPLPPMKGVAYLTDPLDAKHFMEQIGVLEHRALLAEAELSASRGEVHTVAFQHEQMLALLAEAERHRVEAEATSEAAQAAQAEAERRQTEAEHWLRDHQRSASWRLTQPLRAAKRGVIGLRSRRRSR